jgi:hypothetical protein
VSYDVYFFPPGTADPEAVYLALEDDEAEEGDAPTPERESELRALVEELRRVNPRFELSGPYPSAQFWSLQLVDERRDTVLVDFYPEFATAQISYGADDAGVAVSRLLECVRIFERNGYVAYDPQLERTIDTEADAGEIEAIVTMVREKTIAQLTAPRPRFFRRLLGR